MTVTDVDSATFENEASAVLGALKSAVANVLASFGDVHKPADLQKTLALDWKLSWQLFRLAGSGLDVLSAGPHVPTPPAVAKFLAAAVTRGVVPLKIERARTEFDRFEQLVARHAGDRLSFNSMIAAAAAMDDEWEVGDTQHRRNTFRGMSHATGLQAKVKLGCNIFNYGRTSSLIDVATLTGYLGLRMFRPLPLVQVFRSRLAEVVDSEQLTRDPLDIEGTGSGYLLENFSSRPLPAFSMRDVDAGWVVGQLENPLVGNLGVSTLLFGIVYRNLRSEPESQSVASVEVSVDKPVELVLNDLLAAPGLVGEKQPHAEVFLGNNLSNAVVLPGDIVPLIGNFTPERLGTGPDALANPSVPDYPEMVRAAAKRLDWNVEDFEAWRIRIEFPTYSATVRMRWE